ncbi:MAG TPA: RIP metalloprotease RseP, partial [Spirochaetia bacterium]
MILTILLGIVGLGIMVFVHELGHFVAARICGVGVEVFSLGWGPRMVGFTRGGTTYQVSWIPIGGYCKMKGELVPGLAGGSGGPQGAGGAAPSIGGSTAIQPVTEHEPGSFLAAPPWRRIVIAAFGPLFNVLFALVIFFAIWWAGFNIYSTDNRVVLATDYTLDSFTTPPPATAAGLKTGDRVTAINGAAIGNFQDILEHVSVAPNARLVFTVVRTEGGVDRTLTLPMTPQLDKDSGAGRIGIYAWFDPVVDGVTPGSAAGIAGLRKGDRIVAVDGKPVRNSIDLSQTLSARPAKVDVTFERSGAEQTAPLVFVYDEKGAPNLGISFASLVYRTPRLGPGGAVVKAADETWTTVTLTVKSFGLLFQGIKLRNAVAGPLRITYYIGTAATSGFQLGVGAGVVSFLRFLAFLSVVLFLMNLLPIPAMDGGQIILFIVEIIRGRPVQSRAIWQIQLVGFSLLIMLALFVTFSDVL